MTRRAGMGRPPRRERHAGLGKLEDGRARGRGDGAACRASRRADPERPPRALVAVYGTDYGVHSPTWISRFTDMTRQAASYREGRVLLAGDAAHVHSPVGGQGLNTGVQDAVNLGWKLAQVVKGTSPESLLDTYHAERHPVAARVLRTTMAQTALTRADARINAVRDTMAELLAMDEPRKRFAAMMSGLDIHYDLGEGHPLLGRRMPDLDLVTADGPCGCSRCCTTPGRCCSTSASPAASTSLLGRIASSSSTPNTPARGSFRCSAPSLLPPPC